MSSLNFANRTKRIEVREIENEPIFKGYSRAMPTFSGKSIGRQPLRPLANTLHNSIVNAMKPPDKQSEKQVKAFSVYSDKARYPNPANHHSGKGVSRPQSPHKRPSDIFSSSASRPLKKRSLNGISNRVRPTVSKETIEDIVEKKVSDILAARALDQPSIAIQPEISKEVQRRLDLLEKRIDGKDDGREQGLTFLLMAKQHGVRGEHASALRMYTLAKSFFPDNEKLDLKIGKLQEKLQEKKGDAQRIELATLHPRIESAQPLAAMHKPRGHHSKVDDRDYQGEQANDPDYESDAGFQCRAKVRKIRTQTASTTTDSAEPQTPRTRQLLEIVNGRDIAQIRLLKGVGVRKAEAIVEALCAAEGSDEEVGRIHNLEQLGRLRGVSTKTVQAMRSGL